MRSSKNEQWGRVSGPEPKQACGLRETGLEIHILRSSHSERRRAWTEGRLTGRLLCPGGLILARRATHRQATAVPMARLVIPKGRLRQS